MRSYLKILFSAVFITALAALPAQADPAQQAAAAEPASPAQTAPPPSDTAVARTYYNYAHNESEYSVKLPEAPTVRTIWVENDDDTVPFMKYPPADDAALGEVATFRRVDIDTEESFDVKITFIRARQSFLQGLTEKRIKNMLMKQYNGITMTSLDFSMSQGTGTLKWATLSGFTLDAHNHPAFCVTHYLTGQESILVVQVMYSIENKLFQDYYDHLVNSITYVAP